MEILILVIGAILSVVYTIWYRRRVNKLIRHMEEENFRRKFGVTILE
jgi:uncharacterized ion transporter superfamily protein YfcC